MPAGQERTLRRRIRSIESTQKITRAMELIAASRIVRAQQAIRLPGLTPSAWRTSSAEIAAAPEAKDHWIFAGGGERSLVVVLGADRGLGRGLQHLVHRVGRRAPPRARGARGPARVIGVGRKVRGYFHFEGRELAESFEGITDRPRFEDAQRRSWKA